MSHVTTIENNEIYDMASLKQMCLNEKWEFISNKTNYAWYGRHVGDYPLPKGFTVEDMGKCDHVIHVPGASYEIGVVLKDGQWKLIYDFYSAGQLNKYLGKDAGLLKQAYGIAKTQNTCNQQNKSWSKQDVSDRAGWKKIVVNMSNY